ncbi:MAG: cytochrome c biogenesis protein ResB, partial [Cyanobacteria bacterium REEB65]|nr:cytochrome c biogenesis protein ResB [Cyanobacteria bacterium REEB65]
MSLNSNHSAPTPDEIVPATALDDAPAGDPLPEPPGSSLAGIAEDDAQRAVRAELQGPSAYDVFKTSFIRFWSSVKLAVVLIVAIALSSTIGTIIPQGDPSGVLGIEGMSDRTKHFLLAIQAYDVYYSPWFLGLLALFFLNLAVCTYVRVWPRLKFALDKPRDIPERARDTFPTQIALPGISVSQVERALHKKFYRTFPTKDGGIAADRNRLFRFAPMVVHLGLFMILIGGITAGLTGFKDSFPLLPGDTMTMHQAMREAARRGPLTPDPGNLKVKLEKFWMTHYPDGSVKQFYSTLSVFDKGKKVETRTIHVNDPLRYKAIWVYQSFFG